MAATLWPLALGCRLIEVMYYVGFCNLDLDDQDIQQTLAHKQNLPYHTVMGMDAQIKKPKDVTLILTSCNLLAPHE